MANKNTRRLNVLLRKAHRQGEEHVTIMVPVFNYHNIPDEDFKSGRALRAKTFPVAHTYKDGVVSATPRKNLQQKVYVNRGEGATGTASMTCHEQIDKKQPITFRGHKYMEYRQPIK